MPCCSVNKKKRKICDVFRVSDVWGFPIDSECVSVLLVHLIGTARGLVDMEGDMLSSRWKEMCI